jgi:hypothetical protein
MKLCSSDARSEGQSGDSLGREGVMLWKRKQKALVGRVQWEIKQAIILSPSMSKLVRIIGIWDYAEPRK